MLSQIIQRSWYQPFGVVSLLLLPLSLLFCALVAMRRVLYSAGIMGSKRLPVPVIVVGNITVGGTGKTPLVIALVEYLRSKGYKPGVVSRGYGGNAAHWPQMVTKDSQASEVGDEAVVIANRCQCPVSVGPVRATAAESLLREHQCDIIISDDGLQHLALQRDIEIVVIDGLRRFGNGLCLPAGPLRELPSRLNRADIVVSNGSVQENEYEMQFRGNTFADIYDEQKTLSPGQLAGEKAHAVAGIGNNERFFNTLEDMRIVIERHAFADHYSYQNTDFDFNGDVPVLMTEKDAVKCRQFKIENAWYLKGEAILKEEFFKKLDQLLGSVKK